MNAPTPTITDRDHREDDNTLQASDALHGGSESQGEQATAGTPAPAREAPPPNHPKTDTGAGGDNTPDNTHDNTLANTHSDTNDPLEVANAYHQEAEADTTEPTEEGAEEDPPDPPRASLRERIHTTADRWGLDVVPPSLANQGLPPLNHARSWAERGDQAPATGPARTAYRAWEVSTRPPRYVLALSYHLLSRPGRTVVALVALALVLRIPGVTETLSVAATIVDAITLYTGLQWALGLA